MCFTKKWKNKIRFTDESYGEVYIEVLNSSGQAVYSNRTNVILMKYHVVQINYHKEVIE